MSDLEDANFRLEDKATLMGLVALLASIFAAAIAVAIGCVVRVARQKDAVSVQRLVVASLPLALLASLVWAMLFVVPVIADRVLNGDVPSQQRFVDAVKGRVSERVRALHASLFIVDAHADSLLWSRRPLLDEVDRGHVDVPRLLRGNVALQFFTIVTSSPMSQNMQRNPAPTVATDTITLLAATQGWGWDAVHSKTARALAQCAQLHAKAAASNGTLTVLKTLGDLNAYALRRKPFAATAGLLGVEGVHIDGNLDNIDRLRAAGVVTFGLTHFFDTPLAGSAHGERKAGLTELGVEAVKRIVRLGGIVDISHASPATIDDLWALELPEMRVMATHAGVRGVCDHVRNLRDSDIRGIARHGGVVAVGFFEPTVCGESHLESVAKTIHYIVDLVGIAHVALGSDWDGAVHVAWAADEMIVITQLLSESGFTDSEIARIMGGNIRSLLETHLPNSDE